MTSFQNLVRKFSYYIARSKKKKKKNGSSPAEQSRTSSNSFLFIHYASFHSQNRGNISKKRSVSRHIHKVHAIRVVWKEVTWCSSPLFTWKKNNAENTCSFTTMFEDRNSRPNACPRNDFFAGSHWGRFWIQNWNARGRNKAASTSRPQLCKSFNGIRPALEVPRNGGTESRNVRSKV